MSLKIYPHSKTWYQLAALDHSPWIQFLLKEMPMLLEDAYVLAQEMLPAQGIDNPEHLKKMTVLLQERVQDMIIQKMRERGISA